MKTFEQRLNEIKNWHDVKSFNFEIGNEKWIESILQSFFKEDCKIDLTKLKLKILPKEMDSKEILSLDDFLKLPCINAEVIEKVVEIIHRKMFSRGFRAERILFGIKNSEQGYIIDILGNQEGYITLFINSEWSGRWVGIHSETGNSQRTQYLSIKK